MARWQAQKLGFWGSFHEVGVFTFLSLDIAHAFRECPGDLEQSEPVPVFCLQGLAQPFCYGPSRSHQWSREEAAFLGVPRERCFLGHLENSPNTALFCDTTVLGLHRLRGLLLTKPRPHRSLSLFIFLNVPTSDCYRDLGLEYLEGVSRLLVLPSSFLCHVQSLLPFHS